MIHTSSSPSTDPYQVMAEWDGAASVQTTGIWGDETTRITNLASGSSLSPTNHIDHIDHRNLSTHALVPCILNVHYINVIEEVINTPPLYI